MKRSIDLTRLPKKLMTQTRLRRNYSVNVAVASCHSQNSSQKPGQPWGIESIWSGPFLIPSPTPISGPLHLLTPLPGILAPSPQLGPCSRASPPQGALPSTIFCKTADSVTCSISLNHFEIRLHIVCIIVCFPYQNVSFVQASVLFAVVPTALKQGLAQSRRIQGMNKASWFATKNQVTQGAGQPVWFQPLGFYVLNWLRVENVYLLANPLLQGMKYGTTMD